MPQPRHILMVRCEYIVQQSGLARAEKPCDDGDGNGGPVALLGLGLPSWELEELRADIVRVHGAIWVL